MAQQRFQAGMLDRKGRLERQATIKDERGTRANTWDVVKSVVHCHIMQPSGRETDTEGGRQTAFGRVKFLVRYLPEARATMRFVVEGRIYDIKATYEPEGTRRQWTVLDCQSHD